MSKTSRITIAITTALVVAAIIDAWAGRSSYVGGDTVSYMDMADGIANGDLRYAVNGHFGSLYTGLLAIAVRLSGVVPPLDFAAARVVNIVVFLGAFLVFRAFLRRFLDLLPTLMGGEGRGFVPIPRLYLTIAGYALFAWGCFSLTMVSRISPDLCILAMLFAGSAFLLAFLNGEVSQLRFLGFGAVLGIGYLFKAIFFPIAIVFLAAAGLVKPVRAVKYRLLLSVAAFMIVASPQVAAISLKFDHLTFGDSGSLSYWWEVLHGNPSHQHWQGGPAGYGTPLHPTRQIMTDPEVYEFGSPIIATYPPWYEPTYWNIGYKIKFDPVLQFRAIKFNIHNLIQIGLDDRFANGLIILALLMLLFWRDWRISRGTIIRMAPLWVVGGFALAIYVPILVSPRYLAGTLPLLALLAISALEVKPESAKKIGRIAIACCIAGIAWQSGPRLARAAATMVAARGDVRNDNWLVAEEFQRLGVPHGTQVAAIDRSMGEDWPQAIIMDWAKLAGVRIVSEVPWVPDPKPDFWSYPSARRAETLAALRRTGALFAIASGVPNGADTTGWTQLAKSRFFYRKLP